ncbi:uncharacterized protein LOC130294274 isoform X2 [Hyla sarda]|uniref:uncharacterized protein LOC130294274 isoform X2 n=1 Tax=Hyla sarda TaxID=327740 RepID=UPI0024C38847|nr:uncharacterized protein LOC130294274 isoform X2 [Hyla sarda]
MAQSGFAAFLLFLGLVVSNVYGENATLCETILNATLSNTSLPDFNLTVSPAKLSNNTVYQVELHGTGNFTVLLQAVTLSSPVGKWSPENNSCNGSLLSIDHFLTNSSLNITWTSPENVTSVTINAYIHNDTLTFLLQQTLSQEAVANTTTEAPTTAHKTESTKVTEFHSGIPIKSP